MKNNIAQTIINVLFSDIKIKKDHLLYQNIYKACFHFSCPKLRSINNPNIISNNFNIMQANVNKL